MRISLVGLVGLVGLVALGACEAEKGEQATEKPKGDNEPAVEPAPTPKPPPPPAIEDQPWEKAREAIRPMLADSVDTFSDGQAQLVFWAVKNAKWDDVFTDANETSHARVKKDSEPEAFKKMCIKGRVLQINKDSAKGAKVFRGLMIGPRQTYFSFVAVGSTGDIVEKSRATLCGLVAGNHAFSNVSGGQTQTVLLIGMFDLPENREGSAEAKH